jgi:prephenate dehydratase
VAARQLVPKGAYIPCLEFIDVFRGVEEGYFDLGVLPVENSLEGAVTQVNDLLTTTALKVIGEVKVSVSHCLLATEATDYREIRQVFSHPQALAQCRNFLMRNKLEARPYYDTAGAAKMLARENPRAAAAIASSLCAELYDTGLPIPPAFCFWPANRTPTTGIKHPSFLPYRMRPADYMRSSNCLQTPKST